MKQISLITLLVASSYLTACVPVGIATGVAASTGIAAGKEGGLKSAVSDTGIRARINDYWFKYDTEMFSKVGLTVDQGRVLLTGVVQKPEHRVEAVRLAWQAKGVKQVINEIQVGNERSFGTFATDKWITSRMRTEMILNRDIQSINYSVDTVKGVVYLMGVAQDQKELSRVIRLAQKIKGVKQVVSYVKMVGEPITSIANGSINDPIVQTQPSRSSASTYSASTATPPVVFQDDSVGPSLTPSKSDIQSEVLPP